MLRHVMRIKDSSTMQFEYDPERLIDEVEKRPGIWDFESVAYRAKNVRQKLWAEVVQELNQNTNQVTKSELRELELQLQKKWKSIRDCFQKYIANPNRTKRPYLYLKKLQFLLKHQDVPMAEGGCSDSDDGGSRRKAKMKWRKTTILKTSVSDEDENNDEVHDVNLQELPPPPHNYSDYDDNDESPTPAKVPNQNACMEQFAFANVEILPKNDDCDPDRLFLLSLLPHLKSIPDEFRLNVKMELMQVLQNANYSIVREHKII